MHMRLLSADIRPLTQDNHHNTLKGKDYGLYTEFRTGFSGDAQNNRR